MELLEKLLLVTVLVKESSSNKSLIFCVRRSSLKHVVVEFNEVIKLHKLLQSIVTLTGILLLEISIPYQDWRINLISDVVESGDAVLDLTC